MKNSPLRIFLLLLVPLLSMAQQDVPLPGRVIEQNSRYRTGQVNYLEGAFIYAKSATPTRSDANGSFTLVFAGKPAGNAANVSVKKTGYKLVNEKELENAAILGRLSPLKVVLCNEERLRENQLAYYQIAEDIAAKEKARRLAILEKDAQAKATLIARLEKELNRKISGEQEAVAALEELQLIQQLQGENAADRLLLVNLDDASDAFRRAFEAFLAKDLAGAIAALDSIDSKTRLEHLDAALAEDRQALEILNDAIAKKEEQKRQELEQVVFKARLYSMQSDFAAAEKTYALAYRHDSTNVELLWELAEFNANLNRFDSAIFFAKKALSYPGSDRQQAGLWNIVGVMLQKQQNFAEGETALLKALDIAKRLVLEDSLTYLPQAAKISENLGHHNYHTRQLQKAGKYYEQALNIWQRLLPSEPEVAYLQAASTLNHLGLVYRDMGQAPQADTLFRQSLHIFRELDKTSPGAHEDGKALTLQNLGALYIESNNRRAAEEWLLEALAIRRRLAEKNAEAQRPELAGTLQNLGLLYSKTGDYEAAKTHLLESMAIYEKLCERQSEAWMPGLANTLNILGVVYAESGAGDLALDAYLRTLEIRKTLAAQNPAAYEVDLWTTYLNLCVFYKKKLLENFDANARQQGLDFTLALAQRIQAYQQQPGYTALIDRIVKDVAYFRELFQNATAESMPLTAALEKAGDLENEALKQPSTDSSIALLKHAVALLDSALLRYPEHAELKTRLAQLSGGMATTYLFNGHFIQARLSAEKGLAADAKEPWINLPLAPALLFLGEQQKALSIYRFWKDVYYHGDQTFGDVFLHNLDELAQKGYTHPDVEMVRKLLRE